MKIELSTKVEVSLRGLIIALIFLSSDFWITYVGYNENKLFITLLGIVMIVWVFSPLVKWIETLPNKKEIKNENLSN